MTTTQSWPHPPDCAVTAWEQSARTVRLTLPVPIAAGSPILIGVVGAGWLEATDDPKAPYVEVETEMQSRQRLAISARGGLRRFAAGDGDKVLIVVSGAPGRRLIRVVALDCLEQLLRTPTQRPPHLFQADGWDLWRTEAHAASAGELVM